jgi:hypothetical protein
MTKRLPSVMAGGATVGTVAARRRSARTFEQLATVMIFTVSFAAFT